MTLTSLLLLAALGALAWRLGWRRLGGSLLALALIVTLAASCGLLPRLLMSRLQNGWPTDVSNWGQRNAIVLLGGASVRAHDGRVEPGILAYGRIFRAWQLYQACTATAAVCRIEVSGGDPARQGKPLARVYARVLRSLGVPAGDLILETRSLNTWQNAQYSAPLLAAFQPDRIVLVSSAMHLWRAQLCFEHFGMRVEPVRADYLRTPIGLPPQSASLMLTDMALHEYAGVAAYRLYWWLGWKQAP